MTKNLFSWWKVQFPVLNNLWSHIELSQRIILATAILHNMAEVWEDLMSDGGDANEDGPDPVEDLDDVNVIYQDGV